MRIQPRQQLLRTWRATARTSFRDGAWVAGGRVESSSVSDAEQLLCIMLPATEALRFRLDNPDEIAADVRAALSVLGDELAIPQQLIKALDGYMRAYTDPDGAPVFSGGSYITAKETSLAPTSEQAELDLVESYAASIRLTLATIAFCRSFRAVLERTDLIRETVDLEMTASRRLTAAMAALLRSFSVLEFKVDSPEGKALLRTLNQDNRAVKRVLADLSDELSEVRAGLRDIYLGSGQEARLDRGRLFQCGWSWGVIASAPRISWLDDSLQRDGVALDAPYLYFTVVALDSITDLFSRRTRLDNLLDEEQERLARALEIRWDLTQSYWATIASFGSGGRWPLEDIPWQTIDNEESDYFSLLVTAIAARDLAARRDENTADLSRLGGILNELANRSRVTRRSVNDDPALLMHHPGVSIPLEFATKTAGPDLVYRATEFAPLLLKRTLAVAESINDVERRRQLLDLADSIWEHVDQRRLDAGLGRDLWDQPDAVFTGICDRFEQPSWHHTLRVVESLILAADMANSHPLRSPELSNLAHQLLAEAEHLFDQERLRGPVAASPARSLPGGFAPEPPDELTSTLTTVAQRLRWVRDIIDKQPGTAAATLFEILSMLGRLAAARTDVAGAQ